MLLEFSDICKIDTSFHADKIYLWFSELYIEEKVEI